MARSSRHPCEVRERAVALVLDTQSDYGSQWEAIVSVAEKVRGNRPPPATTGSQRSTHCSATPPSRPARTAAATNDRPTGNRPNAEV